MVVECRHRERTVLLMAHQGVFHLMAAIVAAEQVLVTGAALVVAGDPWQDIRGQKVAMHCRRQEYRQEQIHGNAEHGSHVRAI